MTDRFRLEIGQVTEQKIEQKIETDDDKGKASNFYSHNYECNCPTCRIYYTVRGGKVIKRVKNIVSLDRSKTLDSYEYIMNRKINKFVEAEVFSEQEE
jgi:hypothetical protein